MADSKKPVESKRLVEFKERIQFILEREKERTNKMERQIQENGGSPVVRQNGTSWLINGNELEFNEAFGQDAIIES